MSSGLLVGVSVTGPSDVGVMVNICGAAELVKVSTLLATTPPDIHMPKHSASVWIIL